MAFRKATVAGTKALTCIYSESGGGKTLSALLIARGLAGPDGKIAMIDTENRRGELYADDPRIGGYDVMQLEEPFSPRRYMAAIDEAEKAGYGVLVIDSVSHEWEGIGGVLDMAASIAEARFKRADWNKGKDWDGVVSFGDWKEPKTEHKHLINRMMQSSMHIVCCARAHYKSRQIDKKDYAKYGIESRAKTTVLRDEYQSPIQEERFIFEMTIHMQMSNATPGVPIITKCPDMLLPAFPQGERVTVETGRRMAEFYNKGAPASPSAARVVEDATEAAGKGMDAYRSFFEGLSDVAKRDLVSSGQHEKLKATAAQASKPDPIDELTGSQPDPDPDDFPGDVRKPGDEGYVEPSFDD